MTEKLNIIQEEKINILLEEIYTRYGFDFREYSISSLQRRINKFLLRHHYHDIEHLISDIKVTDIFTRFLEEVMVSVTEMFRDPSFFLALREQVFPVLSTYPFLKIWDAGCATGEELFSLAILLDEEGLLKKTKIYATDISQRALLHAKEAIYSLNEITKYSNNYNLAGGKKSLSDYYTAKYNSVIFKESLIENIVFYPHNLATDSSFNEFNLILCRNVLIYFQKSLQEKVYKLFNESLSPLGFLALGKKETLSLSDISAQFDVFNKDEKIYKKNTI